MIEEPEDWVKDAVRSLEFQWRLIASVEYRIPWEPADAAIFWKIVEQNSEAT